MNASEVRRFVNSFINWYERRYPLASVYGWQLGNEVEYDRTGHYSHSQYWAVFKKVMEILPGPWVRVSGGNPGREKVKGKYTLNGFLASEGHAKKYNIILDVHGNNETSDDFESELREIPAKYPGVYVGCYEDQDPRTDHSHAAHREGVARSANAVAYGNFGARRSWPKCRWGVRNTGKKWRHHVGVEGCGFEWKPRNAEEFGLTVHPDFPVEIDDDSPPPPPPPPDPGKRPGEDKALNVARNMASFLLSDVPEDKAFYRERAKFNYRRWYEQVIAPLLA